MADEPRPMSQDEIDALFASLSGQPAVPKDGTGPTQPEAEAEAEAEAAAEEAAAAEKAGLSQEEVDQAVAHLGLGGKSRPPPSSGEPTSLSQDDIDSLLADMGAEEPATEPPAPGPPAGPSGSAGGALDQDDIDALLADLGAGDDTAAGPGAPVPTPDAPTLAASTPSAAADRSGGTLSQDDIDALLADMGVDDGVSPEAAPAPSPASAAPAAEAEGGGTLGQDDIDALLAEMGVDDGPAAPAPEPDPTPAGASEAAAGDGAALSQGAIDALLESMGADDLAVDTDGGSTVGAVSQTDAMVAAKEEGGEADDGPLSQADIDALLAEMGVNDEVENAPVTDTQMSTQEVMDVLAGGEAPDTPRSEASSTNISQETLDDLLAKHDGSGDETEQLINQDDIDALVRQMSEATAAPPKEQVTQIMQERESDIEALLDQAASDLQATDPIAASGVGPAGSIFAPGQVVAVGGVAPEELRGTRWLLVAAVFFLMMCSVTMVFVVHAMNTLSQELRAGRQEHIAPTDDYTADLQVARSLLAEAAEEDRRKGENFMLQLRRNYPKHEVEITLLLAEHFRAEGRHEDAVAEFATVADRRRSVVDDPAFYLDYADSHYQQGELRAARRVLMRMLANEHRYLVGNDPDEPLAGPIYARNRATIRRAYLLLGHIDRARADELIGSSAEEAEATDGGTQL